MKPVTQRERRRLKYMATLNDEALPEATNPDFELQYIDIGNVDSSGSIHQITTYRFEAAPSRARRIVRDGDVIISTVRTYLQAIAPIANPPDNLIVSTGFAVVRPCVGVLDTGFCKYALREPRFLWEVESRSVGVSYPAINSSELGDIRVDLPPLVEQRRIADYLDAETAQIDALMAEKEHMLALLEEKRAALISRAVTRGLDSDVPLKPSGLEWLGDIPVHWEIVRLKFLAEVRGGLTLGKNYNSSALQEYPYLRVANVQDGHLILDDVRKIRVPESEAKTCMLERGDVLMNEGGDADKLGRGCIWHGEIAPCLHQNHVFAVRPLKVTPEWLDVWTSTEEAKQYFESRAKQTTNLASISGTNIKELSVIIPPQDEQIKILDFIVSERARTAKLEEILQRSIALLKERRSALITAAVTGQLQIPDNQSSQ